MNKLSINGGKKICNNLEKLKSMWPPKVEKENDKIIQFIEKRNFTSNRNDDIKRIEEKLEKYMDSEFFSFFSSGASALHAALIACDVSYGDEVIVPAYTFAAPAFAVLRVNAIPIFADVNPNTYNIDEVEIIKLLNKFKKVKAIIAVHMNGYPANVKRIRQIADEYNVKLIEDVAQAFGAKIDNKYVGTFGHIGCFSFMPAKQLASCGELGGLCTNDINLFNKANSVKTYGQKIIEGDNKFYYNSFTYGYNYKPSPLNCVFLEMQLKNFKKNISIIQKNVNRLNDYIEHNVPFLIKQKTEQNFEHVYHFCRYRCNGNEIGIDNNSLFRECLFEIMEKEGLPLRIYQTHPVYKQEIFQQIFQSDKKDIYPWAFNKKYIDLYEENYKDDSHKNTLDIINNTFAIGGVGAAPGYFLNPKIVDLYIQGFKKINENIDELINYYKNKGNYKSPYESVAKLSDTKGDFK